MKKQINIKLACVIAALTFVLGIGINNFAMSDIYSEYRIAVVDVNKVVAQSSEVQKLNKEQTQKLQDLEKWVTEVRNDVNKQTSDKEKQKLIKKYDEEFAKRQQKIKKDYSAKLQTIDRDITQIIANQAKSGGYDMVLSKNSVLFGGNDITQSILKAIK